VVLQAGLWGEGAWGVEGGRGAKAKRTHLHFAFSSSSWLPAEKADWYSAWNWATCIGGTVGYVRASHTPPHKLCMHSALLCRNVSSALPRPRSRLEAPHLLVRCDWERKHHCVAASPVVCELLLLRFLRQNARAGGRSPEATGGTHAAHGAGGRRFGVFGASACTPATQQHPGANSNTHTIVFGTMHGCMQAAATELASP
jgi:hypothetical protein